MGWDSGYSGDQWVSFEPESTFMDYLNYILLGVCLLVLVCSICFVIRECCHDNQRDDETEMIVMSKPATVVPSYTESTVELDRYYNHRILQEYGRHVQSSNPPTGTPVGPLRFYAYDQNQPATYYMYPVPSNATGRPGAYATAPATAPAQQVQRNRGNLLPLRQDERPPPYAPKD